MGPVRKKLMMEARPTLICIPDISGFTRFMSETRFELNSKVVTSLLNQIIYSNNIGLKISEIEGDAVLFFKNGDLPDLKVLLEQCNRFYLEFYEQIEKLRSRFSDSKGSEKIPEMLGLKIILHYGESIGEVVVGKNIKLMGEDVIVAHRLLKNNLALDEYILISEKLWKEYLGKYRIDRGTKRHFQKGNIETEHIGRINFYYKDLRPLLELT